MASRVISRNCLHLTHPAPAARAFLALAAQHTSRQGNFSTSAQQAPQVPLEFLIPSIHGPPSHQRLRSSSLRPTRTAVPAPRLFSSSAWRGQTAAIFNPQKDDDGKEMTVEITPRAANRLSEIMAKDSNPNLALRIQVESGGCHGFQYLMSLTTLPTLKEGQVEGLGEDETVFEAVGESGARVVMDGPSLELLKGSKVDFTMELIGSQFKIVDNPLATSSCGCGTSFDIKA